MSSPSKSSSSSSSTTTPTTTAPIIQENDTVHVTARTWPGINKPGGVARVSKVHDRGVSFDVAYILGGREKNVKAEYVQLHATLTDTSSLKRAAAPKPGEFALPSSKRRKPDNDAESNSDDKSKSNNDDEEQEEEQEEEEEEDEKKDDDAAGDSSGLYKRGDIVVVEARLWPGINKPGGVGRVMEFHAKNNTVSVRYILGGFDKEVDLQYVKPEESHESNGGVGQNETRSSKKNRERGKRSRKGSSNDSEDERSDSDDTNLPGSPSSSSSRRSSGRKAPQRTSPIKRGSSGSSTASLATKTPSNVSSSSSSSSSSVGDPNAGDSSEEFSPKVEITSRGSPTEEASRSPVSRIGYIMYEPDMKRYNLVRTTVKEMFKRAAVLAVSAVVQACNRSGGKSSSSSSSNSSSSVIFVKFTEKEMSGYFAAMEPGTNITYERRKGIMYENV